MDDGPVMNEMEKFLCEVPLSRLVVYGHSNQLKKVPSVNWLGLINREEV